MGEATERSGNTKESKTKRIQEAIKRTSEIVKKKMEIRIRMEMEREEEKMK